MRNIPLVLTREQCRQVDRYAIDVLGIPGVVLMENAGRNVAEHIHRLPHRRRRARRAVILAGKGNNGGDGFVIARHLARLGWAVGVQLAADPSGLSGDALVNFAPLERMDIPCRRIDSSPDLAALSGEWERSDVIVDALLGTGFEGQVREPLAGIIRAVNTVRSPAVIAVDIPSGLDADSGRPGGAAVQADQTVTFLAHKRGFQAKSAARFTGKVFVADIGIPLEHVLGRLGIDARR